MLAVKEDTLDMFYGTEFQHVAPFRTQLLKWIGNKQRFAHQLASYFPTDIRTYFEPFLGSGAVLAALQPRQAIGSDAFGPLMEIWTTLASDPERVVQWYRTRYAEYSAFEKPEGQPHFPFRMNALRLGITPAQMERIYSSCVEAVTAASCGFGNLTDTCQRHVARIRR